MDDTPFALQLEALCRNRFGGSGPLAGLRRLSGGASMESWRFAWTGEPLILRRLPDGRDTDDAAIDAAALSLADQADLIALAHEYGVAVPAVRTRLVPGDGLGEGFVMACAPGEALPQKLLRDPAYTQALAGLAVQWAAQLAAIHAIPVGRVSHTVSYRAPPDMLSDLEAQWRSLGGISPIYALAFGWLERALPEPAEPRLCHGDFRMGNLLITPDGLSAVLDWELAHLGDPVQDLAFGCIPSWRFGRYDKVLGGFDQPAAMLDHYAMLSGAPVDPARFRFWLVYSCLWWGVCCLTMADIWRRGAANGADDGPERLVIGRRVSEVEIDLLLMLADNLPAPDAPMVWPNTKPASDAGVPAAASLVEAVRGWVSRCVTAKASGHARFEAKVAENALGMAARDAAMRPALAAAQTARLHALGSDADTLRTALRNDPSAVTPAMHQHLRLLAVENCLIDQPGYAGLARARELWSHSVPLPSPMPDETALLSQK